MKKRLLLAAIMMFLLALAACTGETGGLPAETPARSVETVPLSPQSEPEPEPEPHPLAAYELEFFADHPATAEANPQVFGLFGQTVAELTEQYGTPEPSGWYAGSEYYIFPLAGHSCTFGFTDGRLKVIAFQVVDLFGTESVSKADLEAVFGDQASLSEGNRDEGDSPRLICKSPQFSFWFIMATIASESSSRVMLIQNQHDESMSSLRHRAA